MLTEKDEAQFKSGSGQGQNNRNPRLGTFAINLPPPQGKEPLGGQLTHEKEAKGTRLTTLSVATSPFSRPY